MKPIGVDDEYTCAECGETFIATVSYEEAQDECDALFPGTEQEPRDVVCDDCFQALMGALNRLAKGALDEHRLAKQMEHRGAPEQPAAEKAKADE